MKKENQKKVPEYKLTQIKEITNLFDDNNTILFASIKGLPAKQFQQIKKAISKNVEVRVLKKRVLVRAIEKSKKEGLKKMKDYVKEDLAVLISQEDSFNIAETLDKKKSPVKAKAGQEAIEDIEIEAGETDIPAGPAVSELGSLGLTVKVKSGKIEIAESRVIVKKGKKINETAASVMGKLGIMPFSVGFIPIASYDSKEDLLFTDLTIDKDLYSEMLKGMYAKANAFAQSISYICEETIKALLFKASMHEKAISLLISGENSNNQENDKEEK
jgi:large subunit ribosomal protein L10